MVLEYKDFCTSQLHLVGPQSLREQLLTLSGYKVVKVSYKDFNPDEKMVKKVQLLERLLKQALQ